VKGVGQDAKLFDRGKNSADSVDFPRLALGKRAKTRDHDDRYRAAAGAEMSTDVRNAKKGKQRPAFR